MVPALTPQQADVRRRRVRTTAWWLVLLASAVYFAFIIAFINRK